MTTPKPPLRRRDATGHLDPRYARELLAKARETRNTDDGPDSARAFLDRAESSEELAEELGEAFIEAATSGEESEPERHEKVTAEESGGPFVVTRASKEFAQGTDESNIAEALREPLPRTSKADP
jgi:superfamily II DNA or RNA helicase